MLYMTDLSIKSISFKMIYIDFLKKILNFFPQYKFATRKTKLEENVWPWAWIDRMPLTKKATLTFLLVNKKMFWIFKIDMFESSSCSSFLLGKIPFCNLQKWCITTDHVMSLWSSCIGILQGNCRFGSFISASKTYKMFIIWYMLVNIYEFKLNHHNFATRSS